MKCTIASRAEKQFKKLPKIDQIAITRKIRSLSGLPRTITKEEKLSGYSNIYRVRIGQYRIVYRKTAEEIYIVVIHHRRDVYQLVRRVFE